MLPTITSGLAPLGNLAGASQTTFYTQLQMNALLDRGDNNDDDDDDDDEELDDDDIDRIVEVAMAGSKEEAASIRIAEWKDQLRQSPSPPFTTMRRVRIEKEIALLKELAFSDDASDELANMWQTERGPVASKVMSVADILIRRKDSAAGRKAEAILVRTIEQEGLHFVAPLLLLAWRYALSGNAQESKDLYELVLTQKPWHMGALVGYTNACKHLNDKKGLLSYECLPSLDRRAEREQWVDRMVAMAQKMFLNAEQGLQSYFDTTCDGEDLDGCIVLDKDFGEGAWQ